MEKERLYNYESLSALRKDLHKHPETAFEEFRTGCKLYEYLETLGVKQNQVKKVAKTGFIIDLKGKAPESGKPFCVALRTDMDALPIREETPDIDYKAENGNGHMCGHDLHMASILGGAAKIIENLDKIPSDKTVRLLFQPAEERWGGALPMIQEGCLDGVDEVYGFHNWPFDWPGKLVALEGPIMAASTRVFITIHGKGGHASEVFKLNDPLQAGVDIQVGLRKIVKEFKEKGREFVLTLPVMHAADEINIISDTCDLKGILRTFDDETTIEIKKAVEDLVRDVCTKRKCKVDLLIRTNYPPVVNHSEQTGYVIKSAEAVLGKENVLSNLKFEKSYASEDFSYFLRHRPGCFFFMSSLRKGTESSLHTSNYNPDDKVIEYASDVYLKLVLDRFGVN